MKRETNWKLATHLLLCTLLLSFLFIDDGIIGRLRPLNTILLVFTVALAAREIWRSFCADPAARGGKDTP